MPISLRFGGPRKPQETKPQEVKPLPGGPPLPQLSRAPTGIPKAGPAGGLVDLRMPGIAGQAGRTFGQGKPGVDADGGISAAGQVAGPAQEVDMGPQLEKPDESPITAKTEPEFQRQASPAALPPAPDPTAPPSEQTEGWYLDPSVQAQWDKIQGMGDEYLGEQLKDVDLQTAQHGRRMAELNALTGGQVGGAFGAGQAAVQLGGQRQRIGAMQQAHAENLQRQMNWLDMQMGGAEAAKNRDFDRWLTDQKAQLEMELLNLELGALPDEEGELDPEKMEEARKGFMEDRESRIDARDRARQQAENEGATWDELPEDIKQEYLKKAARDEEYGAEDAGTLDRAKQMAREKGFDDWDDVPDLVKQVLMKAAGAGG